MQPRGVFDYGLTFGLALTLFGLLAGSAHAQGSFDPYSPLLNQYNSYAFPSAPSNLALPGAARRDADLSRGIGAPSTANQFSPESIFSERDRFSEDAPRPRGTGIGVPYTQSYRQYDRDLGRIYSPNERVDKGFYEGQQERYKLYLDAMREKDPKKRAQMLREVNNLTAKAGRDLSLDKRAPIRPGTSKSSGNASGRTPTKPADPATTTKPAERQKSALSTPISSLPLQNENRSRPTLMNPTEGDDDAVRVNRRRSNPIGMPPMLTTPSATPPVRSATGASAPAGRVTPSIPETPR